MSEQFSGPRTQPGESAPAPDFGLVVLDALLHAQEVRADLALEGVMLPIVDSEYNAAFNVDVSAYRDAPDDFLIEIGDAPLYEPSVVWTADREEYRQLLRQCLGVPMGAQGNEETEHQATLEYEHEVAHADHTARIAPQAAVVFAVSFFKSARPDGSWQYYRRPSVITFGTLRKIDIAMITVVLASHATGHPEILTGLGYTSREEVVARYQAVQAEAIEQSFEPSRE